MRDMDSVGLHYFEDKIDNVIDDIPHLAPSEYIVDNRYLPRSVTPNPGYLSFEDIPYWEKPFDQIDPYDPTREMIFMKGWQNAFTTMGIESPMLYIADHLKAFPMMFATADKEMAHGRIEANVIPMFQQSGKDIFQSADVDNPNKTGKTKNLLQWTGGGYCVPQGARNADKMRMWSIMYLLMDEIDAWPQYVGKDGDPIKIIKGRCSGFWDSRKVIMGSTPLLKGSSHVHRNFLKGNQQVYKCRCVKCGYPQELKWRKKDLRDGSIWRGFRWDYTDGQLDIGSVRYECINCGEGHEEHDKDDFINRDNAFWEEKARAVRPHTESYHMPSTISKIQPWYRHVEMHLDAYDPDGKLLDIDALQVLYNNVFGTPFEVPGSKLGFQTASHHRRSFYVKGIVPNSKVEESCTSGILFTTMTVDVQDDYLSTAVWGWTDSSNPWVIDRDDIPCGDKPCTDLESVAWQELSSRILEREFKSDDGKVYGINMTLIDSGYAEKTVAEFCDTFEQNVYPIKGVSSRTSSIKDFSTFLTSAKTEGYSINVDHYKLAIAPVLRREWVSEMGNQKRFHLNAPSDMTDEEIKQLTREAMVKETQKNGTTIHRWHRSGHNETWDLLIYALASLDIFAHNYCFNALGLDEKDDARIDWGEFWSSLHENNPFYEIAA